MICPQDGHCFSINIYIDIHIFCSQVVQFFLSNILGYDIYYILLWQNELKKKYVIPGTFFSRMRALILIFHCVFLLSLVIVWITFLVIRNYRDITNRVSFFTHIWLLNIDILKNWPDYVTFKKKNWDENLNKKTEILPWIWLSDSVVSISLLLFSSTCLYISCGYVLLVII